MPGFAGLIFNMAVTSDYVWRGVSQTEDRPAFQSGLDWDHSSGFFLGAWGSNVSFEGDSDVEMDFYGGFNLIESNHLKLSFGLIVYDYIDIGSSEEVFVNLCLNDVQIKYSHQPDSEWNYLEGSYGFSIKSMCQVGFHLGHFDFEYGQDYSDWRIWISKGLNSLDFELSYINTDVEDDIADDRVVLTISKSW